MHICRNCNQSFQTELALELHRDGCSAGDLLCQVCGDRFLESDATEDGWHYECPNQDCDGSGLTDDLFHVDSAGKITQ